MKPAIARAIGAVLLVLAFTPMAQAQVVRAWLDRNQIAIDETATLNIEVTGPATGAPAYAPLLDDFRLSGHSSTRSYQQVNDDGLAALRFPREIGPGTVTLRIAYDAPFTASSLAARRNT